MKTLLLITLIFMGSNCFCKDFKISYNLLTAHTFSRGDYANKLDDRGIFLMNKMFFIEKNGLGIILGEDSAGVFVYGGFLELPLRVKKFSLVLGAYSYSKEKWEKSKEPYLHTEVGSDGNIYGAKRYKKTYANHVGNKLGFIPIIGVKYNLYKQKYFETDLFISVSTINLLAGFRF